MQTNTSHRLLSDDAMQRFLRDGYVALRSELPPDYHARMFAALDELDEGGPRGHNNLLPCVPELSRMLDEPVVKGALTSILGDSYYLHFHRHDHFQFPGDAQALHKDGDNHSHAAVDGLRRMHRTRFAMLFYYPQDTPLAKGPTGIVPGSQYLPRRSLEAARKRLYRFNQRARQEVEAQFGSRVYANREAQTALRQRLEQFRIDNPAMFEALEKLDEPWESAKIPLTGDAGSIAVVHFDLVHGRYRGNTTDQPRHMVKFLFTRDRDPVAPTWRDGGANWPSSDDPLTPTWRSLWHWHQGRSVTDARFANAADLASADDRLALGTAYALGAAATANGLGALVDAFLADDIGLRTIAAYGLVAAEARAVPRLLDTLANADAGLTVRVLDVLGDIGAPAACALPAVVAATSHDDVEVRRYATEALGTLAQRQTVDIAPLTATLADDDALVRRNAALATARLAPDIRAGEALVNSLVDNLYHWHHHVRGWAIEALQRLRSPAATQAALRYLATTRWDPTPKSGDVPPTARRLEPRHAKGKPARVAASSTTRAAASSS